MITLSYGGTQGRRRRGERAQTTRIASFGPFGEFFLKFLSYFLYILTIIDSNGCYDCKEGPPARRDEENGPKRRETRRLGHKYVFFFLIGFFRYSFIYTGTICATEIQLGYV